MQIFAVIWCMFYPFITYFLLLMLHSPADLQQQHFKVLSAEEGQTRHVPAALHQWIYAQL